MAQNIYDNNDFFAAYSRLARSVEGLDGAPEWPTLRAMLPDLRGRNVLDLGCGFGWFCRWAREHGAARVIGIDLSEKMLERARAATHDGAITYMRDDLDHVELPSESFDLVYSSLAFHYLERLEALMGRIHRALGSGGSLVFSVEHPIYTAPSDPKFSLDAAGRSIWPVDRYLDEGPRTTDWLAKGVVKQHRTIASYVNMLIEAGFSIARIEEWGPMAEQIALHPEWAVERDRPPFLLIAAKR
jgi:SAM-dependent methyltransferase